MFEFSGRQRQSAGMIGWGCHAPKHGWRFLSEILATAQSFATKRLKQGPLCELPHALPALSSPHPPTSPEPIIAILHRLFVLIPPPPAPFCLRHHQQGQRVAVVARHLGHLGDRHLGRLTRKPDLRSGVVRLRCAGAIAAVRQR